MTGTCQGLNLKGPLEKIRASYSNEKRAISGIRLYRDGLAKTFGNILPSYEEWLFNDSSILMGLHGQVQGEDIKNLGFITLNSST